MGRLLPTYFRKEKFLDKRRDGGAEKAENGFEKFWIIGLADQLASLKPGNMFDGLNLFEKMFRTSYLVRRCLGVKLSESIHSLTISQQGFMLRYFRTNYSQTNWLWFSNKKSRNYDLSPPPRFNFKTQLNGPTEVTNNFRF